MDWKTSPNPWHDWARVLKPGGSSIHVATSLFLLDKKSVANKVVKDFFLDKDGFGSYWHKGGPLEPLSLTSSLLETLPRPPEDLFDSNATLHVTLGASTDLFGSPEQTRDAPKWLQAAFAKTLGVEATFDGAFTDLPITFPGSPRKFAGVLRSMSAYVQFLHDHPDERERAKRDEDAAANIVRKAIEAQAQADAVAAGQASHVDQLTDEQIAPFRIGFDDPLLMGQAAGIIFARRR